VLRWRPSNPVAIGGAVASTVVAVVLFTRFSINQRLWRDEAIYVYGGQRFAHGVPPYVSIFDPKAPLATMFAGLAATAGRVLGVNDIHLIRLEFFVFSCLTVLAVYVLAYRLWRSVAAALLAAVVFVSFPIFAQDAIGGPDAKTPAILAMVVTMWLLLERRWFWAGVAAAITALVWQPLFVFPIAALALPALMTKPERRRRSVLVAAAGVAIPTGIVGVYFLAVGAFGKLIEATVTFPLTGNHHVPFSLHQRYHHMTSVIWRSYGAREALFIWFGLGALVLIAVAFLWSRRRDWRAALRHPLIAVMMPTLLVVVAFLAWYDFQGPEDTLPLTAYAAIGLGGIPGVVLRALKQLSAQRVAVAAVLVASAVLAGITWPSFDGRKTHNDLLLAEYSQACAIDRMVGAGGGLYALGDPTPLVITHRTNPDRFIYLEENVSGWKIRHTAGGFDGWVSQIEAAHPSVIVLQLWYDANSERMRQALVGLGYTSAFDGGWHVYLLPAALDLAARSDVRVTHRPTRVARALDGRPLPQHNCSA
jgi:hypothetical protein